VCHHGRSHKVMKNMAISTRDRAVGVVCPGTATTGSPRRGPPAWRPAERLISNVQTGLEKTLCLTRTVALHDRKTPQGKQRYRCRETACRGGTFLLDSSSSGQSPHIKAQIVNMAINASGIRDTARELHVNPTTVIPTVSPLMIPLVPCHINSFQRASSVEKPWPGGENRLDGRASHPEAL
jgi:InsA C-terminal domain